MRDKLVISAASSISSLGWDNESVLDSLNSSEHCLSKNENGFWTGSIAPEGEEKLKALIASNTKYKLLDRTAILALFSSLNAWNDRLKQGKFPLGNGGVNFGSSRGATGIFEARHREYQDADLPNIHTSPTTTLGAVSSWVGRALNLTGPAFSHSVTCSTALYAIGNAMAWINAGMADFFVAGGTEAPLTAFTIDQMRALKIYSELTTGYPSLPLGDKEKGTNTMVLGEGAGAFVIEKESNALENDIQDYIRIEGIGFANENITSPTSISQDGKALQSAMKKALKGADLNTVDLVIAHAPGTFNGDVAEVRALESVFEEIPSVTSYKWKTGHTLGASTALAIDQAIHILKGEKKAELPYKSSANSSIENVNSVMINGIGFGGNAGSIILSKNKTL